MSERQPSAAKDDGYNVDSDYSAQYRIILTDAPTDQRSVERFIENVIRIDGAGAYSACATVVIALGETMCDAAVAATG